MTIQEQSRDSIDNQVTGKTRKRAMNMFILSSSGILPIGVGLYAITKGDVFGGLIGVGSGLGMASICGYEGLQDLNKSKENSFASSDANSGVEKRSIIEVSEEKIDSRNHSVSCKGGIVETYPESFPFDESIG